MKQLLFVLFALAILSGCNNNKTLKPGEIIGGGVTPPDPNQPKKNNRWGNDPNPGGGTGELHDKLVAGCLQEVGNDPQAKAKCDCWVGKIEARFPNIKNAEEIPENIANDLARDCYNQFAGGTVDPNNPPPYNPNTGNEPNINGSWTMQQRQQYIQGCASTAQQSGLNAQQANSYCDCMTRKIEAKFSFEQAATMTAADFQTQEWQQAAYDCYPKQQQYEY